MYRLAAEGHAREGGFFRHDKRIREIVDASAAVLLGHLDAEHAQLAEFAVEVTRRVSLLLPFGVDGHDLLGDEVADRLAKSLVVFVEYGALHVFSLSSDICRWFSWRRTRAAALC